MSERPCQRPPPGEVLDVDYDAIAARYAEALRVVSDEELALYRAALPAYRAGLDPAARRLLDEGVLLPLRPCVPPPPLPGASTLRRACRWLAPRFPSLILSVRFRRAHGGVFFVNGVKERWP